LIDLKYSIAEQVEDVKNSEPLVTDNSTTLAPILMESSIAESTKGEMKKKPEIKPKPEMKDKNEMKKPENKNKNEMKKPPDMTNKPDMGNKPDMMKDDMKGPDCSLKESRPRGVFLNIVSCIILKDKQKFLGFCLEFRQIPCTVQ